MARNEYAANEALAQTAHARADARKAAWAKAAPRRENRKAARRSILARLLGL